MNIDDTSIVREDRDGLSGYEVRQAPQRKHQRVEMEFGGCSPSSVSRVRAVDIDAVVDDGFSLTVLFYVVLELPMLPFDENDQRNKVFHPIVI